MPILAHAYLLVILLWSSYVDSHLFHKFWHGDGYTCSNTFLYALWSTLILILMHSISFFSRFVFDEFIAKGGEYGHKVGRLFANRVVERRNTINDYLRGRACIESVRGSWFQGECWFQAFVSILSFSCSVELLCWFSAFLAILSFLDLLAVLHGVLDSNFKLCAFAVNGLIKGEIENPSGQFLGLIVMSHWLCEVWIRIRDSFIFFFFYLCFIRRITFACLVVCRWQVRHGVQRWGPW
jgi:hypothetical protein